MLAQEGQNISVFFFFLFHICRFIAPELTPLATNQGSQLNISYTEKADSKEEKQKKIRLMNSNFVQQVFGFGCYLYELITLKKPKHPIIIPEGKKQLKPIIDIMNECLLENPTLRIDADKLVYRLSTCIFP